MSRRPTITSRSTSLAHAFVHAIIPRHVDQELQLNLYAAAGIRECECVYCGAGATDKDHLQGLVKNGLPSGHFHTTNNLVPSCGPCNQSKGGTDWKAWMLSKAKGSPSSKGVRDLDERVGRLEIFQRNSGCCEAFEVETLREKVGAELWDSYWQQLEDIKDMLRKAQTASTEIERLLAIGII
jgi:hypothetical protein